MISNIRFHLKNFIAHTLYYTGILFLIKKIKLKDKIVVLMYHRVLPNEEETDSFSNPSIIVQSDSFQRHLKFLKKQFSVLSISEFRRYLSKPASSSTPPACLITFDDGWVDNYLYAYPILREENVPALIFLPKNYIDNNNLFWQESLSRSIHQLVKQNTPQAHSLLDELNLHNIDKLDVKSQKLRVIQCVNRLKNRPLIEIKQLAETVSSITQQEHNDTHIDRYLTLDQIKEMYSGGVSFGSHACSHRILTQLSEEEIQDELSISLKWIEQFGQEIPITIAYPNGNSNSNVQNMARETGYDLAFGTSPGCIEADHNKFNLKRINIHEMKTCNNCLLMMSILGIY